jgi:Protein of unknown function (DUF3500)
MRLHRLLLTLLAVVALVGIAYVGQSTEPAGSKMATAAQNFLDTLKEDQKERAAFKFDDKERTNWYFTPRQTSDKKPTRKGLSLQDMTEAQRKAALELVRAGTSPDGYTKATTIMSLESILRELEAKGGTMVRDPEWYFFTVFGTPSKTGKWGWRVEGHHLSLNFTLDGGKVVSSTPAFFGANPASVKAGPRKGLRTLPEAEDLARELFASLDNEQKAVALRKEPFPETPENSTAPKVGEPVGLPAAKMTDKQRDTLVKLLQAYASRMPDDIADVEMKQVKDAGIDKIHFAYSGGVEDGQPHTYRVQGPTVVVEFLNMQNDSAGNPANHIHSSWRNIKGDFGLAGN